MMLWSDRFGRAVGEMMRLAVLGDGALDVEITDITLLLHSF
jgi:hypothetical protein